MQGMMTDSRGTTMVMMNSEDSGWWLVCINVHVLQGSEFRSATKDMGWVEDPYTEDDIEVYDGEKNENTGGPKSTSPPTAYSCKVVLFVSARGIYMTYGSG